MQNDCESLFRRRFRTYAPSLMRASYFASIVQHSREIRLTHATFDIFVLNIFTRIAIAILNLIINFIIKIVNDEDKERHSIFKF